MANHSKKSIFVIILIAVSALQQCDKRHKFDITAKDSLLTSFEGQLLDINTKAGVAGVSICLCKEDAYYKGCYTDLYGSTNIIRKVAVTDQDGKFKAKINVIASPGIYLSVYDPEYKFVPSQSNALVMIKPGTPVNTILYVWQR